MEIVAVPPLLTPSEKWTPGEFCEFPVPILNQCPLHVLVAPGAAPIRCRRHVWVDAARSGVCYACHPRGREEFIGRVVRRVLSTRELPLEAFFDRGNRRRP